MDHGSSLASLKANFELDSWLYWEVAIDDPADVAALAEEAAALGLDSEWDPIRAVLRVRRRQASLQSGTHKAKRLGE